MVEIPSVRKPDMALHRTLVYVASFSGYDRLFRVTMDVLSSLSAGEVGRWAAERPPRAQARRVTRARELRYIGIHKKGTCGLTDGEMLACQLHQCGTLRCCPRVRWGAYYAR